MEIANISTKWTFRLDADERISPEAAEEIALICRKNLPEISEIVVQFTVEFMGKKLKHGGIYPFKKLLIYRTGKGTIEDRAMDEHIILSEGKTVELKNDSYHHDYKGLTEWVDKHNRYSDREMIDYFRQKTDIDIKGKGLNGTTKMKRIVKYNIYYRLPIGFRAHLYYIYRYYIKAGFLDGKEGKIFCFMQAYWYRYLVDAKIYEHNKLNSTNN